MSIKGIGKNKRAVALVASLFLLSLSLWHEFGSEFKLFDKSVESDFARQVGEVLVAEKIISNELKDLVLGAQDEIPLADPLDSETEIVVIESVVDGDTVRLADGRRLRYIGMDTPETKHPTKGQECFGKQASARNAELVAGKKVRLEKDVSETDRYGRLLRYVWLGDELINEVLVKEGYALVSSFPPDIARQDQFRQAEKFARDNNLGLWAECEL